MRTMQITTLALVLVVAQPAVILAQSAPSGPGTAGNSNAAAASQSVGGSAPTQSGTAPGTTSPGGINNAPQGTTTATPPAANPNQVPATGNLSGSTAPPNQNSGPSAAGSSGQRGTVGSSAASRRVQDDPIIEESEREVSRRIRGICKGC